MSCILQRKRESKGGKMWTIRRIWENGIKVFDDAILSVFFVAWDFQNKNWEKIS